MSAYQKVYGNTLPEEYLAFISNYFFISPENHTSVFKLYHTVFELLERKISLDKLSASFFQELGPLFRFFRPFEASDCFTLIHNFLVRQANESSEAYSPLFNFLEWGLTEGFLQKETGFVKPSIYKNFVRLCLLRNDPIKAIEINSHVKPLMQKPWDDIVGNFNMALIYLYQKKISAALSMLVHFPQDDIYLFISARIIKLKCFFELGEKEVFRSELHSLNIYLRSNTGISGYHRKLYGKFVWYARKLVLKSLTKSNRQKIISELNEMISFADFDWLLEKFSAKSL